MFLNCSLGIIRSPQIIKAMLKVPRELFVPRKKIMQSYDDTHISLPGDGRQTISAPYMYPFFYENICLRNGDNILEIGSGSGYGAALAYEIVGSKGQVVTILEAMKMEIDIEAPVSGTVQAVAVKPNDAVNEGQTIVVIG